MNRTALYVVMLSSSLAAADGAAGKKLNVEGYELYKKGELDAAVEKFKAAVEAAPRLAIAHYNLAATQSRIGEGCRVNGAEILKELKASIALDPARLERAKVDPDFGYVQATVGFQVLLGGDLKTAEGLSALLPKLRFRPPTDCGSDMGCGYSMAFRPGGKLERGDRVDLGVWKNRTGTWRVEERSVGEKKVLDIVIDVPARFGLKPIHDVAQLFDDGRLMLDAYWLTDDPEGCCC